MADFGVFAKLARTRLCGQLWKRGLRQNVLRWLYSQRISIRRSLSLFASIFQAAEVGPLFERFSLGPPFEEFQKMADFGVFAKLARTRLCGQLWKRGLRQNVLRWLYSQRISIRRSLSLLASVFQAAEVGPLFERFSLGPPFEEFQKMADFGVFAKLARTRLCGQLWKRGLRQNVLRWLYSQRISIRRSLSLFGSVFQAAEVGPLFERFSLGPPFEEFQKMADFGVFAKLARTRLCGQLSARFASKCSPMIVRSAHINSENILLASVFQAAEVGPLFERFSLGPPFEEFQKMADFGVFAKLARTRLCGQPRENRSKSGPTSAAWKTLPNKLSDPLIDMRWEYNYRRTFWRKPRLQSCPQSRVLANLAKTPKSAIFWNSSKGGPRENRSKSGPTSAAWKTLPSKLGDLLIDMRLKYNHRRTFWRKPRLQTCPQSRVLANLAKTPKSAIFWNSSKGGPRENRSKSGPTSAAWKTLPSKLGDLLIDMRWKYNHRRTFWRKPRLQSCPQSRVLANLAKTPKSAIFWNSSKGGPRENRSKSGPTSAAWKTLSSKLGDLLIDMHWKYNHRRTFWRKPRLQSCPQSRVLANLAKTTKSAIFLKFFKGGTKEKSFKKWADLGGLKKTLEQIRRSPNWYALKV